MEGKKKMNWIKIAKTLLELLPLIIGAIKVLENLFPEPGQGSSKLKVIKEIITGINDDAIEQWPYIEKTIGVIVAFLNKVGIFKTSEPK